MVASPRLKWFGLALLGAVQFMVVLDIAIVNVALPSIQTDLEFSQANLQWVISAYALVSAGSCCSVGARPTCSAAGACS
jgi:MFS family permease